MITSQELIDLANTVESESQHTFLVEAIESHFNKEVAALQKMKHDNIRRIQALIREQNDRNSTDATYALLAMERSLGQLDVETEWNIKKLKLDRDDALKALTEWENRVA